MPGDELEDESEERELLRTDLERLQELTETEQPVSSATIDETTSDRTLRASIPSLRLLVRRMSMATR